MRRVILAGLAVFVLAMASCSPDPTTSQEYEKLEQELAAANEDIDQLTTTNAQLATELERASAGVFTFAEDDLCQWVSEDEVTAFVKKAYAERGFAWDGKALAVSPEASAWDIDGDYCQWEPTGGGRVIARGLTPDAFGEPVVEFSEDRPFGAMSGHPGFADNIIVGNAAFGRYGFWVADSDEALALEINLPEGLTDGNTAQQDGMQQETALFEVANSFLVEMGWTRGCSVPQDQQAAIAVITAYQDAVNAWDAEAMMATFTTDAEWSWLIDGTVGPSIPAEDYAKVVAAYRDLHFSFTGPPTVSESLANPSGSLQVVAVPTNRELTKGINVPNGFGEGMMVYTLRHDPVNDEFKIAEIYWIPLDQ